MHTLLIAIQLATVLQNLKISLDDLMPAMIVPQNCTQQLQSIGVMWPISAKIVVIDAHRWHLDFVQATMPTNLGSDFNNWNDHAILGSHRVFVSLNTVCAFLANNL